MLIPKAFYNQSFEAEEAAKELTKKIKAGEDAKERAEKSAASERAAISATRKKTTHQKPAKDQKPAKNQKPAKDTTKTTEQPTAPAPAKEDDAPVSYDDASDSDPTHPNSCDGLLTRSISNQAMRCSKSFRALILFGVVALITAVYQSITPPSSAVTVTTPLKPRQRV